MADYDKMESREAFTGFPASGQNNGTIDGCIVSLVLFLRQGLELAKRKVYAHGIVSRDCRTNGGG